MGNLVRKRRTGLRGAGPVNSLITCADIAYTSVRGNGERDRRSMAIPSPGFFASAWSFGHSRGLHEIFKSKYGREEPSLLDRFGCSIGRDEYRLHRHVIRNIETLDLLLDLVNDLETLRR